MNAIIHWKSIRSRFLYTGSFIDQVRQMAHMPNGRHSYSTNANMMLHFFFSPLGRIAQYAFTLGWLFWLSLELACLCGFIAAIPQTPEYTYWFLASMTASGLSTVSVTLLGVKRLRDAGLAIWPALILLIPGLSIIALVVMSNLPTRNSRLDA